MSAVSNVVSLSHAPTLVDHLIAAHRLARDPFTKALVEAALIHEGRKLAASVPIETFQDRMQPEG